MTGLHIHPSGQPFPSQLDEEASGDDIKPNFRGRSQIGGIDLSGSCIAQCFNLQFNAQALECIARYFCQLRQSRDGKSTKGFGIKCKFKVRVRFSMCRTK